MFSGIIQGLVTGVTVGIVLFLFERWRTERDRRLANSLKALELYNNIMLSGKMESSPYAITALGSLFEFVATAKSYKSLDDGDYKLWRKTLKYYYDNYEDKFEKEIGKEGYYYSEEFKAMLEEAKEL